MRLTRLIVLLCWVCFGASTAVTDGARQNPPAVQRPAPSVDYLSVTSMYLKLLRANVPIATATGFIVERQRKYYLITNWHVLSGRDPETKQPILPGAVLPDAVTIVHHGAQAFTWAERTEPLNDKGGAPRWLQHQRDGIDVAVLPLQVIDAAINVYPFDLALADADMVPEISMPVSIIGFPLGLTGPQMFPIWKIGHIASEPMLDYKGHPVFLIDATTRGGMSGSPVVLQLSGGYQKKSGGGALASGGYQRLFLGVYSGRIAPDAEIGKVWRPKVITEILARAP